MTDRANIEQILIDYAPKPEADAMTQLGEQGVYDNDLLDRLNGLPTDPGARHGILLSWVSDSLLLNMDEIKIYENAKEWMTQQRGDEQLASEEVKRMIADRKDLLQKQQLKPSEWVSKTLCAFDESEFDAINDGDSRSSERPTFGGIALRTHEDRLRDRMAPRPMLVAGMLPADGVGALIAMPGVGKSLTATEMARCVAEGCEFAGNETLKGRVIYACPDSPASTERRTLAMSETACYNVLTIAELPPMPGSIKHLKKIIQHENAEAAASGGLPVRLLIVDTWDASRTHTDSGYNGQDGLIEQIAGGLRKLADECKVAVLVTHHATRSDNGRARGSVVFDARLDIWILVEAGGNNSLRLTMKKNRDGATGPCGFFWIKGVDVNGQSMPTLEWGGNNGPEDGEEGEGITEEGMEEFCRGEGKPTAREIAARFKVSLREVTAMAAVLRDKGIMEKGSFKIIDSDL